MVSVADKMSETEFPTGMFTTDEVGGPTLTLRTIEQVAPDLVTLRLALLSAAFEDTQRTRKSCLLRASAIERGAAVGDQIAIDYQLALAEMYKPIEARISRDLKKLLKQHALWPWLEPLKGLSGPRSARLIAVISQPHRFPGQRCTKGHYFPPMLEEGAPCPASEFDVESDARRGCCGTMLPPRPHTGTRSLWHYLGLHVVNGKSPRKSKGTRCDWHPFGRTLVLGEDGTADQIARHVPKEGVEGCPTCKGRPCGTFDKYGRLLVEKKARLTELRGLPAETDSTIEGDAIGGPAGDDLTGGAESAFESKEVAGSPVKSGTGADRPSESESTIGLRPFQINDIAKKVAAKAFVADLLHEWKRLTS